MHIAVCMDVAADRKQLERLLGRSADRRLAACPDVPYYVQSYGNKDALLARPFMYDLFFIDIQHEDVTSIELIRELRSLGVVATIALCPAAVDLSGELAPEDDVLILRQPIQVDRLEEVLDTALKTASDRAPKLDVRGMTETELVREDEFLYAERVGDMIEVHLTGDRVLSCPESMKKFGERCAKFSDIYCVSEELTVHKQEVMSTGFGSIVLRNGSKYRISHKTVKSLEGLIRQ